MTDVYSIGIPFDMQLDDFYVSKWGYVNNIPDEFKPTWIVFLNKTIEEGLKFQLSPNMTDVDTQYKLFIELTDLNIEPRSKTYEFVFTIINENLELAKATGVP